MLRHSNITTTLLFTAVSLLPAGVFATPSAQQGEFTVSVAGTAAGSIPREIPLKMTQIPGGKLSETTGFVINPENVVQVKQGESLIVTTSENLKVNNVKARSVQGQQVDLFPLPNSLWSLQNLVPGAYLLDVIVDMSASGIQGVYETVFVILQPDQTPLPPATVINEISIWIETEFIFEDDDNMTDDGDNMTDPTPEPPPCPIDAAGNEVCPPTDEPIPPICPLDAAGNMVCPPTDEPTPMPPPPCPPESQENGVCPPTDHLTPVPEPPPPDCPEAGPELCGEEPPPEDGPDSGGDSSDNDNAGGNGDGNGDGDGEDGSSGNGDSGGNSNDNNGGTFGGDSFFG